MKVARACGSDPACLQAGTDFPGVSVGGNVAFLFRAYLAPNSTVSPDPTALIAEHVIHVVP